MKKYMKALKIVGNVIIWAFVAFAVAITILVFTAQSDANGIPTIGGKYFINIVSDSMEDTILEDDLIIGQKLSEDEKKALPVNAVITFMADLDGDNQRELNTHRIIGINYTSDGKVASYVTKGDNKPLADVYPVFPENVVCKWTETRYSGIGGFLTFLQTRTGFGVVIILPLIAFFLFELIKFILTLTDVKSGKKKLSAADEEAIKQKAIEEYIRRQKEAQAEREADSPAPPPPAIDEEVSLDEEVEATLADKDAPESTEASDHAE